MKLIAIPILVLVLLVQSFAKWVIIHNWEMNQGIIANELCRNKEKPALKCGGKCQLAKSLAHEKEHNSHGTTEKGTGITLLYMDTILEVQLFTPDKTTLQHNDRYRPSYYSAPHVAVFHPPSV